MPQISTPSPVHIRDWLDYLTGLTPIFIAAFVAFIGCLQAVYARRKLRLDLYNKRFDVFEKALLFHETRARYDGQDGEEFLAKRRGFLKAAREARFLFPAKSGVRDLMMKMADGAFAVSGFKEGARALAASAPTEFITLQGKSNDAFFAFAIQLDALEERMSPYLDFHGVAG